MHMFYVSLGLLLAIYAVQIVNYEVILEFQNPVSWSTMLAAKCGASELNDAYQSRSLSDFGAVSMIWGAFWGFLI